MCNSASKAMLNADKPLQAVEGCTGTRHVCARLRLLARVSASSALTGQVRTCREYAFTWVSLISCIRAERGPAERACRDKRHVRRSLNEHTCRWGQLCKHCARDEPFSITGFLYSLGCCGSIAGACATNAHRRSGNMPSAEILISI